MARSLEGWLVPQQGLKSSRFPSWRSHLDGRQRPLPSVSLLPVSGWPTSNPSYRGPCLSAEDDLDLPPGCCPTLCPGRALPLPSLCGRPALAMGLLMPSQAPGFLWKEPGLWGV